jgi:hypothetical protein
MLETKAYVRVRTKAEPDEWFNRELTGWLYNVYPFYIFLHQSVGPDVTAWSCTEFYTGMKVAGASTMQGALDEAAARIKDKGVEEALKARNEYLEQHGQANTELPEGI